MRLSYALLPLAMLAAAPASAAVVLDQPGSTGIIASPGTRSYTFNAVAGNGSVSFNLEGYLTLDGLGSGFDDLFTVTLNGTVLSSAYFNLGGNGSNSVLTGASPVSIVRTGYNQGGVVRYAISGTPLLAGPNTLTFSYASATPQGTGDEGWGLNSVLVNDSGVPEPVTWGMMILGFGMIGASLRRAVRRSEQRFDARIKRIAAGLEY